MKQEQFEAPQHSLAKEKYCAGDRGGESVRGGCLGDVGGSEEAGLGAAMGRRGEGNLPWVEAA